MDLVLRVEDREGWAIISASGDFDLTTAPRLRERLVQVIMGGQPRIVLDLQAVDFIDSTGLGVLVGLLKRTRTQGGDLRLVSQRSGLRKLLELTALEGAFPLAASIDDVLEDRQG